MDAEFVLRIVRTIVGCLGILGNGLVCLVIAKVPVMRTITNAFIFNQAVIDFLASLCLIIKSNCFPTMPSEPTLAVLYCYIWESGYYLWVFFLASSFNLMVLTSERFVAIVYPFKYVKLFGAKQAGIMIAVVWVTAFGYKAYLFATREIRNQVCKERDFTAKQLLGVATFLIEYFIPLLFLGFCYVRIILCLKQGAARVAQQSSSPRHGGESLRGSLVRAKRNTIKTLIIVFMSFIVCWSANQISYLMSNFGWPLDFNGNFYIISVSLAAFNSCVNPFIYAIKYRQFKKSARSLLLPCIPARTNRVMVASTSFNIATRGQNDSELGVNECE
ncbi:allatostatin-A receptor-like [Patiria miniata]|uniref:G-protein coupled receptors family 1 profile domain-containing protein n=1 Tax=Patiria miniata TaxID=46514 RepID=A0A913ZF22_PATMI|nr:allatostatin-A receptor-like [Patiria miniata]